MKDTAHPVKERKEIPHFRLVNLGIPESSVLLDSLANLVCVPGGGKGGTLMAKVGDYVVKELSKGPSVAVLRVDSKP